MPSDVPYAWRSPRRAVVCHRARVQHAFLPAYILRTCCLEAFPLPDVQPWIYRDFLNAFFRTGRVNGVTPLNQNLEWWKPSLHRLLHPRPVTITFISGARDPIMGDCAARAVPVAPNPPLHNVSCNRVIQHQMLRPPFNLSSLRC